MTGRGVKANDFPYQTAAQKENDMPRKGGDARRGARSRKPVEALAPATMDIRTTATYLGVSEQTVRSEANAKRLPAVRIRGRILIVKKLLDEMLLEQARSNWNR